MACERKQTFLLTSSANKRQRNRFPAMFVRGCLVIDKQPFLMCNSIKLPLANKLF